MPNKIALISKYSPEILDEIFAKEAVTSILERNTGLLKFTSVKTVLIPSIIMDGLGDYTRADQSGYGYSAGSADVTWESFTLSKDRGKQFKVDSMDDEETQGIVVGNLLDQFVRLKEVPEVDAYRLSKLYSMAFPDQVLSAQTIAANTIISAFNTAFEKFADAEIPEEEQVLFVSNAVMTLIRNTTELYKKITQEEYKNPAGLTFTVNKYENRPIITVPKARFYTAYTFGSNGFAPASGAKLINFMLVHFNAALPIKKHQVLKVFGPEVVQDFDGFKMNHRLYHDIFTPKHKRVGIYVNVSSVAAVGPMVYASTVAGASTNGSIVTLLETPVRYDHLMYIASTSAITPPLPGVDVTSTYTTFASGDELALSTNTHICVVAVDADDVVLAASADITAVKKA